MRKNIITAALMLVILSGCEFIPFSEYNIPPYDGDFTWTKVTAHAPWKARLDHAAVAFDDKLWILGGYNPGQMQGDTYFEDIWNSADGAAWQQVNDSAPWHGRRGHAVITFNDGNGEAMYLIGGFEVNESSGYRQYTNDVWKSTDGATWQLIKERSYPELDSLYDWFPRMNHTVVAAQHGGQNYLYLIGGSTMLEGFSARYSMKYFNDVWRSTDGINWENLYSEDYGIRAGHAATVDPVTQRIYIQGGMFGVIFEGENNETQPLPDWRWLWRSDDGIHWTPENDTANFDQGYLGRAEHQMAFYNNTLYAFPGKTNSTVHFHFALKGYYSIWKKEAGNLWSVDSNGSATDARYSYALVNFDQKIWILGGDTNTNGPANDVWSAEIR